MRTGTLREANNFLEKTQYFPLQDLSVHVVSERPETQVVLEEDESEVSSINVQSFVDEQQWKLHSHVEVNLSFVSCVFVRLPGVH